MKIEFLTQDDPLYVLPFFERFVQHYASEFDVLHIATCPTMGKRSRTQMVKELTQLYGVAGIAQLVCRLGVSRLAGLLPRKSGASSYATLAQLCRAYGILCTQIGNPNAPEFVDLVRHRSPDLLVSVACPFILKEPLLNLAPKGAINIHHAPLPRYKGMMPTFWQMYHGEKTVGLTIHYMVARVDEGRTLLQEEQPIEPGETLHQLIKRSKRHGADALAKVLRQLRDGTSSPAAMDLSMGSYYTFPTAGEIKEFHRRGLRAI